MKCRERDRATWACAKEGENGGVTRQEDIIKTAKETNKKKTEHKKGK